MVKNKKMPLDGSYLVKTYTFFLVTQSQRFFFWDLHHVCVSVWRPWVEIFSVSMLWEGKSSKGNVFKPPSTGDEHWSLGLCCWAQRSHFCQCSTERAARERANTGHHLLRPAPWRSTFRGPNSQGASTWGCPITAAWYRVVFTKSLVSF